MVRFLADRTFQFRSQMGEEMAADLKEAEEEEASSVQDFEALTAAKNKEIAAATSAIEDKTERVGKVP